MSLPVGSWIRLGGIIGWNLFEFDECGMRASHGVSLEALWIIRHVFLSAACGYFTVSVCKKGVLSKNISRPIEEKIEALCRVGKCDIDLASSVEIGIRCVPGNARGCVVFAYSENTSLTVPDRVVVVCLMNLVVPPTRLKTNRENGKCVDVSIICF